MSSPRLVASVSEQLMEQVQNLATVEQRSLSQMTAILIQRGIAVYDVTPAAEAPIDQPAQSRRKIDVMSILCEGLSPSEQKRFDEKFRRTPFSSMMGLMAELAVAKAAAKKGRKAA